MKNEAKVKISKRNFVAALAILLMTNIIMSVTLMTLSKHTLREQINQRMLDIANTAAYQLNGDELKNLKAEDEGSESYNNALQILRAFQDNIQLDYIYGIRAEKDGTFTFTIDPDEEDPGEFGAEILTTKALQNAAGGRPDVDIISHNDQWGRFYSAYSPVFDSNGEVAGIVGVDFNADWYDNTLNSHRAVSVFLTIAAFIVGVLLSNYIMKQNNKRFSEILEGIERLDQETQKLDSIIMKSSIKKLDNLPKSDSAVLKTLAAAENGKKIGHNNEYEEMSSRIEKVNKKFKEYLKYIDSEIYMDDMTGLYNKTAYKVKVNQLSEEIEEGKASFALAFFDINGAKDVYANYGYEAGDKVLFECGKILKNVFDKFRVYHIIGDEFIVIVEGTPTPRLDIQDYFAKFEAAIDEYNKTAEKKYKFTVSKGAAVFDKGIHGDYRNTIVDAKANCEKEKLVYYKTLK